MSHDGSHEDVFSGDVPAQGELDRAVAKARAAFAWRAHVDTLRGEGVIDGIRAEVAGSGGLHALTVPTAACSEGGDVLAQRILDATAAAQADLARQIEQSALSTFGDESEVLDAIRASLTSKFGLDDER